MSCKAQPFWNQKLEAWLLSRVIGSHNSHMWQRCQFQNYILKHVISQKMLNCSKRISDILTAVPRVTYFFRSRHIVTSSAIFIQQMHGHIESICTLDLSEGDVGYRGNGKNVVRTMKSLRVVNNRWSLRYLTSFVIWFRRSLWLVLWRAYALIGYAFGYASRATFFCSHRILMLPVKHPWQHLLNRHTSRMFF